MTRVSCFFPGLWRKMKALPRLLLTVMKFPGSRVWLVGFSYELHGIGGCLAQPWYSHIYKYGRFASASVHKQGSCLIRFRIPRWLFHFFISVSIGIFNFSAPIISRSGSPALDVHSPTFVALCLMVWATVLLVYRCDCKIYVSPCDLISTSALGPG
jgi:hypothetical protein